MHNESFQRILREVRVDCTHANRTGMPHTAKFNVVVCFIIICNSDVLLTRVMTRLVLLGIGRFLFMLLLLLSDVMGNLTVYSSKNNSDSIMFAFQKRKKKFAEAFTIL